jgi:hypothetical protein
LSHYWVGSGDITEGEPGGAGSSDSLSWGYSGTYRRTCYTTGGMFGLQGSKNPRITNLQGEEYQRSPGLLLPGRVKVV